MEITREVLRLALYITGPWFLLRMWSVFPEWIVPMICGVESPNHGVRLTSHACLFQQQDSSSCGGFSFTDGMRSRRKCIVALG